MDKDKDFIDKPDETTIFEMLKSPYLILIVPQSTLIASLHSSYDVLVKLSDYERLLNGSISLFRSNLNS